MSPTPDPAAQLRGFHGQATRDRPVLELKAGQHHGRARVTPIRLSSGRRRFSIDVTWRGGPAMHGFPPMPLEDWEDRDPPERHDMLLVDDLELAKAIAQAAIDELRAGRAPDTRALKRRFAPA